MGSSPARRWRGCIWATLSERAEGNVAGWIRQEFTATRYRDGQGDRACPLSIELAVSKRLNPEVVELRGHSDQERDRVRSI